MSWYQKSGELPYKTWPDIESAEGSGLVWHQKKGDLPYKGWPSMYTASPPVSQNKYVCAYDMHCAQTDFDNNGICILCPTICEITEELNGAYELYMEHPIDAEGRWKHILELNIIKAGGQLFRIYRKQTALSSDGEKIRRAYARHIFYDLNDKLLDDVRPIQKNGQEFIDWIMTHMFNDDAGGFYPFYAYSWASDIETIATSYFQGSSPVGALIGEDNCFINRLGGEIHRDNFYFSINEKKEFSEENCFDIRYGIDMIDVEEIVDYSDIITHIRGWDNFGNGLFISYTGQTRLHHNVTRRVNFNYETPDWSSFASDVQAYFGAHWTPQISYRVTYANLENTELYKDFIELKKCNVGDTGTIYCEELDIETEQKVVKKTIDVLSGDTVSIELGNLSASLTRKDKFGNTISTGSAADKAASAATREADRAKIATIDTWRDAKAYNWQDLIRIKWQEVNKS